MRHSTGWAGGEPTNPRGIRSVTVIVTHEDPDHDFSETYEQDEIFRDGIHVSEEPMGFVPEWLRVRFELDLLHKTDVKGPIPWR